MKINLGIKRTVILLPLIFLLTILLFPFCNNLSKDRGEQVSIKEKDYKSEREAMVKLLQVYGIKDKRILEAMSIVRRHLYIPFSYRQLYNPYGDHPCPIGYKQTISQPYIVAYMTERMSLKKGEKVLEVGTGSGYQAAVLAEMGVNVYSIEIIKELSEHAQKVLKSEGYTQVHLLRGDGHKGWSKHAPYDAIIVTCAPEKTPPKLVEQLKEGGRMIIPVGAWRQRLVILLKKKGKVKKEGDLAVRFVPMVHEKDQ